MYRLITLKFRARHTVSFVFRWIAVRVTRGVLRVLTVFVFHFLSHLFAVGYTMRDIRYKWKSGFKSVGISNEVQLPQFRILGHRQRATEINLSTGRLLTRDLTITHARLV